MFCAKCGSSMADGTAVCPNCGAPQSATPGVSGAASSSGGMPPVAFDAKRWGQTDRIVGGATLVLFISLFLHWYSVNLGLATGTANGLHHGYMYITLILSLVVVVYLLARAAWAEMPFKLPLPHEQILTIAAAINLVLTIISFIFKPSGLGVVKVGWSFGAFVGLIAAIVAAVPKLVPMLQARLKKS